MTDEMPTDDAIDMTTHRLRDAEGRLIETDPERMPEAAHQVHHLADDLTTLAEDATEEAERGR
jgi:hypothetical protein